MKYIKLFEKQTDYKDISYKLDYPCVSVIEELDDAVRYEEEPSWVKCVYEIPQEAFTEENSTVNIMNNAKGYIKAYKVNGKMVDIEPERVVEGVEVEVFQPMEIEGASTFYMPSLDACPLAETITTTTIFKLSRQVDVTSDYLLMALYDGDTLAGVEPIPIAELGTEYLNMFYTFSEDGLSYSYTEMFIQELIGQYIGYGFGVFIVDADYAASFQNNGPVNPPILTTTMICSQVIGGMNKIGIKQNSLQDNKVTIEYKLHDNVTLIDGHFNNTNYLKEIDFSRLSSRRKHSIGEVAFENNGSIEKIVFNTSSITSMEWRPFYGCTNLSSLDLNGLTQLGSQAFMSCTSLTSVTIPETITNFDPRMFSYCKGLKEMTFYNYYKESIDESDFYDIQNIQKLNILGGVTTISNRAFIYDTNLNEVIIGNSVTSIGGSTFYGCTNLMHINIPNSVTSIGDYAFSGCTSLPIIDNIRYADTCLVEVVDKTLTAYTIKEGTKFIAINAFKNCSALTSINIPDSVTTIGSYAFEGCSALTSVALSDNITFINAYVFRYCSALTSITIPDSVTTIGGSAFSNCTSLPSITIPDSVTTIGGSAFSNCTSLPSITLPDSVTYIRDNAFYGCSALTSITIPNSVTKIYPYTFAYCSALTSVTIPNSVTNIDNGAFSECSALTSITIPDSVTNIGNHAFRYCSALTSITIPDSVTTIGSEAFKYCNELKTAEIGGVSSLKLNVFGYCPQLTNVIIGSGITNINNQAFYQSNEVTSIIVDSNNPIYDSRENCNAIIMTSSNTLHLGCKNTVIPDSVTSIGSRAFQENQSLTSIIIPGSVTTIGSSAFYGCRGLTSIIIPDSVTIIDDYAFSQCYNLSSITIPDSVTIIGKYAFNDCYLQSDNFINNSSVTSGSIWYLTLCDLEQEDGLLISGHTLMHCRTWATNVTIPDSVTYIDDNAFKYCTNLPVIDNIRYADTCLVEVVDKTLTTYSIKEGTKFIYQGAFTGCTSLTNITIPDSVTRIGSNAFSGCTSLTNVTIPDSVTSIGNYAFSKCASLTNVTIPDYVTYIGEYAFSGCTSFTNVTIPDSVTYIAKGAFLKCSGLTSITLGSGITKIEPYTFDDCTSLPIIDNIRYADTCLVKVIDKTLTTYTIKEGTKFICQGAFADCTSLTNVTIPNSVTYLGRYAFSNCNGLTSITCKATTIPTIDNYTFEYIPKNGILYYPQGSDYSYWMQTSRYYLGYYNWTSQEVDFTESATE